MTHNLIKNQKAFTLIEMIIAVSIFVLVLVIATNIYLVINNTQRKVVTMQRIQSDVRYLFEAIAQEIRLGKINYDFYADSTNSINLHPDEDGNSNSVLALLNQSDEPIFFRWNTNTYMAEYCKELIDYDCYLENGDDGTEWQSVTPVGVIVEDLRFIITPSADPFSEISATVCTANSGTGNECAPLNGYSCPTFGQCSAPPCYCAYDSDGGNFQPKVRIILKTRGVGRNIAEESEMIMQTTVSSRIMPGKVQNSNYE